MDFIDADMIYKTGSNKPGIFSNIRGEEGLWYLKTGELQNAIQEERYEPGSPHYVESKNLGVLLEAYGSAMYNALTPNPDEKLTIKIVKKKLDDHKTEFQIASKLIPGYKGIEEIVASGKKIHTTPEGTAELDGKPIKGLNRNFALRYLVGDFDVANFQNIGLVEKDKHFEGQSIDFGKAFHDPNLTMVHSAYKKDSPDAKDFISTITDPSALSSIFIFTQLIDTDQQKLLELHKDNASEGKGRVNPGILPPSPEEALYPLPDSVGNQAELNATLKHIASLDTEKLKAVAAPFEDYIVEYIEKNKLPVEYKKGEVLETLLSRIEIIREHVKSHDMEPPKAKNAEPDLSSFRQTAPPAIESIDKPKGSVERRHG